MRAQRTAFSLAAIVASAGAASAQLELIQSFNPSNTGSMNSIGYDPITQTIFAHDQGGAEYEQYDRSGTFLGTVAKPFAGGNDDDIEFVDQAITISGVSVPAGSLLSIENENDPPRIIAVATSDSSVLAQVDSDGSLIGQWVGGAYSKATGTFFCVDWTGDEIQEVNPADGSVIKEFPVTPTGATSFDIFFGDIDILDADGLIYIVSSSQNRIRVMSTDGVWFGDLDVESFGISTMSGIGFDDARGEAWISGTNGIIYQLSGFTGIEPCEGDLGDDFGNFFVRDFQITFGDFLAALSLLGPCPGGTVGCPGDLADDFGFLGADGQVAFGDFLYLLTQLGPCP